MTFTFLTAAVFFAGAPCNHLILLLSTESLYNLSNTTLTPLLNCLPLLTKIKTYIFICT